MEPFEKIDQLRRIIESDPTDALAFFLLGSELLHAERFAEAVEAFERTLALKPAQPAAARLLGDALRRMNRLRDARAAYQHAIELAEATGDLQVAKEAGVFLKRLDPASPDVT